MTAQSNNDTPSSASTASRLPLLRVCLIAIAFILGALAMAGWIFNQPSLRSLLAHGSEMKPNTALCLMFLSLALAAREAVASRLNAPGLFNPKMLPAVSKSLSALCAILALLTLFQYWFNTDLGIDQLLFKDVANPIGTSHPGRMSPPTACDFLLGALALLVLDLEGPRGFRLSQWLALAMAFLPLDILICYIYGNMNVLAFGFRHSYMAVPTALALLSIASATLLHTPDVGIMRSITARTQSSLVFRWLLLVLLLLPPIIGWFVLVPLSGKQNPPEFSVSVTVVLCVLILLAVCWFNTARLNRGEEGLRENEARKTAILESALDCIIEMNEDGVIVGFNPAAEKTFGWRRDEIIGKTASATIIPPQHREAHERGLAHFLRTGEGPVLGRRIEMPALRADGSQFHAELAIAVSRLPNRAPFFTAYLRDLTDLRNTQQALLEREAVLRTVTNEAQVGLVMVNQERRYLFANTAYAEILGLPSADIVGRRIADVLAPMYDQISPRLDRAFAGERVRYELRRPPRSGSEERFYEVVYEPRVEHDSDPYVVVVIVDITERKKIQETLEKTVAERTVQLRDTIGELEAYSYSVTHDMRAPLRAMTAYAQALSEDFGPQLPAEAKAYILNIFSASKRMDQLITDVLAYSRVSRSHRTLEPINVEQLIAEIQQQFETLQPPHSEIRIDSPLLSVLGEEASLSQCISNLLLNAVKFVPAGIKPQIHIWSEPVPPGNEPCYSSPNGPADFPHAPAAAKSVVAPESSGGGNEGGPPLPSEPPVTKDSIPHHEPSTISHLPPTNFVRLWFEDNGIGILQKDFDRIFQMFERINPESAYEGTGIGLAIVKKAVERMGGQVGVESIPGKGSRFWLQLRKAQ